MVANTVRVRSTFSGLRPINPMTDLPGVATLIEQAFAEEMDNSGRNAVREMRWLGRLGFLFGWMDALTPPGEGSVPGFVWIEDGQVVGNATVRRLSVLGRGWMIGNVAAAPAWRNHGIARSLMNACVDLARQRNAEWIALQVRSNNAIARGLYESMGFQATGETIQFERTQSDRVLPPDQPIEGRLRAARPADTNQLFTLAQATMAEAMRWTDPVYRRHFELGFERRINDWLSGTQTTWRVIESDQQLWGAAMLEVNRRSQRAQLRLWVPQPRWTRVEQTLVDAVLAETSLPIPALTARLPGEHVAGREALERRGFTVVRALTHMRLDLKA
jgi:ribosomal protein S18 acetylase RimI-like enzyme